MNTIAGLVTMERVVRLRKQARKLWHQVPAGAIVHITEEINERHAICWPFLAQRYVKNELWSELFISIRCGRDASKCIAIIEWAALPPKAPRFSAIGSHRLET